MPLLADEPKVGRPRSGDGINKRCARCKETQPVSNFTKRTVAPDGLDPYCRACKKTKQQENAEWHRAWQKADYQKNKDRHKAYAMKYTNEKYVEPNKLWFCNYLSTHPCIDCGEGDIRVLEFDHREGEDKKYCLSTMRNQPTRNLEAEAEKCDVVCANCHRKRTAERINNFKTQYLRGEL